MFCALPWPEKEFSSTHKAHLSRNYRASLLAGPSTKGQSQSLEEGWVSPAVGAQNYTVASSKQFLPSGSHRFEWIGLYKREAFVSFASRNSHCPSVWIQRRDPGGQYQEAIQLPHKRNLKDDIYLGLNCAPPPPPKKKHNQVLTLCTCEGNLIWK